MIKKIDSINYKKRNIAIWNEVAPRYHLRWASKGKGPFESTDILVKKAKIKKSFDVLDIACGTGVVTKKISSVVGKSGSVIGVDTSLSAIRIAKKENPTRKNLDFILSDAENFTLNKKFDAITCQYALFFFPDSKKALYNAKKLLKNNGVLALSVHGENVPFFSSILDVVTQYIPDYTPVGAPNLDRFGTKEALIKEVKSTGFSNIQVNDFEFRYSPGTFTDYWQNYLRYIAKPLKEKIKKLSTEKKKIIRDEIRNKTDRYTVRNGKIIFPWQVLILTAKK